VTTTPRSADRPRRTDPLATLVLSPRRHRLAATVAVVVATLGLVWFGPAAPSTAASCSRSSCTSKDPHSTGCDSGATTKQDITFQRYKGAKEASVRIELRNSSTCAATWARWTESDPNYTYDLSIYDIVLERYISSGNVGWTNFSTRALFDGSGWSPMVGAPGMVRACLHLDGDGSRISGSCTNSFTMG